MIRVRRVSDSWSWLREYQIQLTSKNDQETEGEFRLRRGPAVDKLRLLVGLGDGWSIIQECDRKWNTGSRDWVVVD